MEIFLECYYLMSLLLNIIFLYIVLLFYGKLIFLLYLDLKFPVLYDIYGVPDTFTCLVLSYFNFDK